VTPTKTDGPTLLVILATTILLIWGCSSSDDEYRRLVEEHSRRQAAQQESLLRQSENLSEASRQLVESDAAARGELAEMQSRLQQEFEAERQGIDGQREKLDDERRDIAARRHRDPLIAAALLQAVTLLIAALPFVLVLFLMRASRDEPADVPLAELLVEEFSTDKPLLLPAPPRSAAVSLPPADDGPAAIEDEAADDGPVAEAGEPAV
jgi:hypothetical protein